MNSDELQKNVAEMKKKYRVPGSKINLSEYELYSRLLWRSYTSYTDLALVLDDIVEAEYYNLLESRNM